MTPSGADWRIAYAKQARADLQAREKLLEDPKLPACQQLHILQMACEKICKAYLCGQGTDPAALQTSHAYIARVLPIVAREHFAAQTGIRAKDHSWIIAAIRKLARKIEPLAPSVTGTGAYPADCEYPWVGPDGALRIPAEHNFQIDPLYEEGGRHLIKVLFSATDDLMRSQE